MKLHQKPKIKKPSTAVVVRDEKGRITEGSGPLNPAGKPQGALTHGGINNREKRNFLATKFYDKLGENWEMIYDNIIHTCAEKDIRALFNVLEYMAPKYKEKDEESSGMASGMSAAEIRNQLMNMFDHLEKVGKKYESKKKNE